MSEDKAGAGGVSATKDELQAVKRELALEIVRHDVRTEQQIDGLRQEIRARSSDLSEKVEKFMTEVGKVDRAQVIADWRLSQLEKRVAAIEPRPS